MHRRKHYISAIKVYREKTITFCKPYGAQKYSLSAECKAFVC
jgi:hypothetical protein